MDNKAYFSDIYITAEELSLKLGVSKRTLYKWARLRRGPPITKVGRRALYNRASVTSWLCDLEVYHRESKK